VVVVAGLIRLRNGAHGYGAVSKLLHWLTVAVIVAQFAVGATMGPDEAALDREKDRIDELEERGEERAERQGEAAEERFENEIDRLEDELDVREDDYVGDAFGDVVSGTFAGDGVSLPELHVSLGLSLIALGVLRVVWRAVAGLPPWAEHLTAGERALEGALEKSLLTLLLVVPGTGLAVLALGHGWVPLHVAAQVALLVVIAVHVGLVLKHTVVRRNRHLSRML
jgi:cytochrome b561